MEEALLKKLLNLACGKGYKIITAESLTAGLISASIAEIAGASDVLLGGFVVYTEEAKSAMLGISSYLIKRYGIVSEEVAKAMATAALRKAYDFTKSEKLISIAVTGIAGPGGGTELQPCGTVCFAISWYLKEKVIFAEAETFTFDGNRNDVRKSTAKKAIEKLIEKLDKN